MARRVVVKRTVEVLTEPKFSVMFATKEAWPIVAPTFLWPGDASAVTKVFNNTSQRVHSFLRGCPGVWEQKLASRSVTIMEMPLDKSLLVWQAQQTQSLWKNRCKTAEHEFMSGLSKLPVLDEPAVDSFASPAKRDSSGGGDSSDIDFDDSASVVSGVTGVSLQSAFGPGPSTPSSKRRKLGSVLSSLIPDVSAPVVLSSPSSAGLATGDGPGAASGSAASHSVIPSIFVAPSFDDVLDSVGAADQSGGGKKRKNKIGALHETLADLVEVHEKKMAEFWECGEMQKIQQVCRPGKDRPGYHLHTLASAKVKIKKQLGDEELANTWENRYSDYEMVKQCLDFFKLVDIGVNFSRVRRGADFLKQVQAARARPNVANKLPMRVVQLSAEIEVENRVKASSNCSVVIHAQLFKLQYPSIVLAPVLDLEALQIQILTVAVMHSLSAAAAGAQPAGAGPGDVLQEQSRIVFELALSQARVATWSEVEEQYSRGESRETLQPAKAWIGKTAEHIVRVLEQVVTAGDYEPPHEGDAKVPLSDAVRDVNKAEVNIFQKFREHESVGRPLLQRAADAAKSRKQGVQQAKALNDFNDCIAEIHRHMSSVSETFGRAQGLEEGGVEVYGRVVEAIAAAEEMVERVPQGSRAEVSMKLGTSLRPMVHEIAKRWKGIFEDVFEKLAQGSMGDAQPTIEAAMQQHALALTDFNLVLKPVAEHMKSAHDSQTDKKQLLPGQTVSVYFSNCAELTEAWLAFAKQVLVDEDEFIICTDMISAKTLTALAGIPEDQDRMKSFAKLCKVWGQFQTCTSGFAAGQASAVQQWLSEPHRKFITLVASIIGSKDSGVDIYTDGDDNTSKVIGNIIRRCEANAVPQTWASIHAAWPADTQPKMKLFEDVSKFIGNMQFFEDAHSVCAAVVCDKPGPGTRQIAHIKANSEAKQVYINLLAKISVKPTSCKVWGAALTSMVAFVKVASYALSLVPPRLADDKESEDVAGLRQAMESGHRFIVADFVKCFHEELRVAVSEIPPNYNEVIESRVVSQIKALLLKQKAVDLAKHIDFLNSKAKFLRSSNLMKTPPALADLPTINLYTEAVQKVRTGAEFFATSKCINLICNHLEKANASQKSGHATASVWVIVLLPLSISV